MIPEGLSDSEWEAEFRKTGKDRQFNSYIAFRRLDIAILNLWREIMRAAEVPLGWIARKL